jgi:putative endonuclease
MTLLYFTYLLRCADGSLYAGITTDLARRFAEHAGAGGRGAKYTAARKPVRFEAAWESADRAAASRLESRLKRLSHADKERLARGGTPAGLDLSAYRPAALPKTEKSGDA